MNQETTTQVKPMPQTNLALDQILPLGIQPIPKIPDIVISLEDGTNLTFQGNGQVAVFIGGCMFACECRGAAVESLPSEAQFKTAVARRNETVKIYQAGHEFFTERRSGLTRLRTKEQVIIEAQDPDDDDCKYHTDWMDMPSSPDDTGPQIPVHNDDDD